MFPSGHLLLRSLIYFLMTITLTVAFEFRGPRTVRRFHSASETQASMSYPESGNESWNGREKTHWNSSSVRNSSRAGLLPKDFQKSRRRRGSKEEYASYASQLFAKFNPLCDRRARAITLYAGSPLMMDCDLCGYVKSGAVWTKLSLQAYDVEHMYEERVIESQEHRPGMDPGTPFYMENLALGIKRVTLDSEGIYQCKTENMLAEKVLNDIPLSYYYVEVKELQSIKEVNLDMGESPAVDGPVEGTKPPLFVYTSWSLWGQCSECDTPGLRKRMGYCYAVPVKKEEFAGGVPCSSTLVPPPMISDLALYLDQQLVIPCRTRCRDRVNSSPFDDTSNPLHVAGSHRYIKRVDDIQTIRLFEGFQARLVCPEAYIQDVVWWRKGPNTFVVPIERPSLSNEEHTSRVFMDPDGSLIFTKVTLNDSNAYRCDVNGRMTASYRLFVVEALIDRGETKEAIHQLSWIIAVYISLFALAVLVRFAMRGLVHAAIRNMREEARLEIEEEARLQMGAGAEAGSEMQAETSLEMHDEPNFESHGDVKSEVEEEERLYMEDEACLGMEGGGNPDGREEANSEVQEEESLNAQEETSVEIQEEESSDVQDEEIQDDANLQDEPAGD